jgi:hypothetical protein
MKRLGSMFMVMTGFLAGIAFVYSCGGGGSSSTADVAALEARLEALEYTMSCAYMSSATINGLAGPHLIFSGVNIHIQNGSARTDSNNGLGNLIVGYNEGTNIDTTQRTGSHNLVIGMEHRYTSMGGLVAGFRNLITDWYTSVTGGSFNTASGDASSVSGGNLNTASNHESSVSGGYDNTASGGMASVSGGVSNTASGSQSSVSGGVWNTAGGSHSSVSGGERRSAPNMNNWAGGGYLQSN